MRESLSSHSSKKSNKPVLDSIPPAERYVLNIMSSLAHHWHGKKGELRCQSYADFTIDNYGKATVVFDGYSEGPSIKDNMHQRYAENNHPIVNFNAETKFVGRKDDFFSRSSDKQGLINLMTEELEKKGCTVINASGDAFDKTWTLSKLRSRPQNISTQP